MAKRKGPGPRRSGSEGYAVGYGKPPQHSRFQPGQSGNPAGRRKGVRNIRTDIARVLRVPVIVKEGGRHRKISTQEAALMVLREKALKGNARAIDRTIELAILVDNENSAEVAHQALSADDEAILADYRLEIAASPPKTTQAPDPAKPSQAERARPEAPDGEFS